MEYAFQLASKERIILAIDEYPYVAHASKSLASTLQLLIDKYKLKTNDFILGIAYNSMMDSETIEQGLQILEEDCIVEGVIHPKKYNNSTQNGHKREFGITQNLKLKDSILRLGFEINNYKNIQR